MKVLSGISVVALLLAGAVATPSFATSLTPGNIVVPAVTGTGGFAALANTGVVPFSFGGDTGIVQEAVGTYAGNPFGASDLTFVFQVGVTAGNIVNLTTQSFAIPGISIDVLQFNGALSAGFGGGPFGSCGWLGSGGGFVSVKLTFTGPGVPGGRTSAK